MTKNKKPIYFWLRLDNNFYKNLSIKKARKMAGGDTMVVIYQKLMLNSLDTNGVIYYEGVYGKLEEELALMIDEETEQVAMTLAYFTASGLIQVDNDQNVEMSQVSALIDQETNWARYKRNQRKLDNVQELSNTRPTEIEIEKEIEKELEIDNTSGSKEPDSIPYQEIVDYLNSKTGKKFKHNTDANKRLIKARWQEGFGLDDFKKVVDKKVASWSDDKMKQYLRPATLFGTKFESYLNEDVVVQQDNYSQDVWAAEEAKFEAQRKARYGE